MTVLAGKYHLQRRLGMGGMAEVYLAKCVGAEGFEQPVAIKRVLKGFANDARFVNMFLAEAKLSARLCHQNIVQVFELARDDDGRPFLVMEVVDGPTLDALLGTGPLPFPAIIFLVGELLRGLAYAHDLPADDDGVKGLVHRDVSPHNVLLSWQGEVKLSDFGIAKVRLATNATASEMLKGKPAYMSPEQANAEPVDGRSDLFAVGVMLWEMLCGRSLFSGVTTHETLARLMFAPIPAPRSVRPEVPEDLEGVAVRLLARDRADRYPDAATAIADLIACADHDADGRARLVALLGERLERKPTGTLPRELRTPSAGPITAKRRPRWLSSVLVAFAVFGAGAGLLLAAQVSRGEQRAPGDAPAPDAGALPSYIEPELFAKSLERVIARSRAECAWPATVRVIVSYGIAPTGGVSELASRHLRADGVAIAGAPPYLSCIEAIVRGEQFPRSKFGFGATEFDFGAGTR